MEMYLSNLFKLFVPTVAFADLGDSLGSIALKIASEAQGIALPVCFILIVFFGIKLLIAPDAQTVQKSKQSLIIAVVAGLIIFAAPQIYAIFRDLFTSARSTSGTPDFKVN